ncbi:MAG: 30S ribosomal protein S13, partial [Candidatus Methylomirabilales bacterium]
MARIAGVDLPRDKRLEVALTHIYGIGPTLGREILKGAMVGPDIRVRDLSEDEVIRLRGYIDRSLKVE